MAGAPDLFVVCKNCQAEVSPYITECPYCGHRLRKRAPKLDRPGTPPKPEKPKRRRPSAPQMPRVSAGRGRRIRAGGRPVVTIALTAIPALLTVLFIAGAFDGTSLILFGPLGEDWWKPLTTTLLYPAVNFGGTAYEVVTLGTIFLFGMLLERRHGHWAPAVVFLVGTVAGMALVVLVEDYALGANAGALALLCAWAVRDLRALRRGEEVEADMLGVLAFAVVMLLMPAAIREANPLAGAGGAASGLLMGLLLARLRER